MREMLPLKLGLRLGRSARPSRAVVRCYLLPYPWASSGSGIFSERPESACSVLCVGCVNVAIAGVVNDSLSLFAVIAWL